MQRDVSLRTDWLVRGGIEDVAAILSDAELFPVWWPEVYLSVRVVDRGGRDGAGRRVALHTRGRLPYTLRWQARMVEDRRPHGWTIEASGDLVGRSVWRLEQRSELVAVRYDWQVAVEKPLLRPLTPILRPVYAANHRWAMARGFEGLNRELARRAGA